MLKPRHRPPYKRESFPSECSTKKHLSTCSTVANHFLSILNILIKCKYQFKTTKSKWNAIPSRIFIKWFKFDFLKINFSFDWLKQDEDFVHLVGCFVDCGRVDDNRVRLDTIECGWRRFESLEKQLPFRWQIYDNQVQQPWAMRRSVHRSIWMHSLYSRRWNLFHV